MKSFAEFLNESKNFDKELVDASFTIKTVGDAIIVKDPDGKTVSEFGFDNEEEKEEQIELIQNKSKDYILDYKKSKLDDFVGRLPAKWKKYFNSNDGDFEISPNREDDAFFYLMVNGNQIVLTHDDGTAIAKVNDWKTAVKLMKDTKL